MGNLQSIEGNRTGFILSNNTNLFYQTMGDGDPIVVLHAGPGLNHRYFLPYLEPISKEHELIFYDMRACGSSGGVLDSTINEKILLDDLDSVIGFFHLDKVNLLAHSFGGLLALHYAEMNPRRIKSLVLVSTMPPDEAAYDSLVSNRQKRLSSEDNQKLKEIFSSIEFEERKASAIEKINKIIFSAYLYNKELINKLDLSGPEATAFNILSYYDLIKSSVDYDYINKKLSEINIPALLIHGDYDPLPYTFAEQMSKRIPGSQFILLNNCGHVPFLESPEIFIRHVKDFLAKKVVYGQS